MYFTNVSTQLAVLEKHLGAIGFWALGKLHEVDEI